MLTLRIAVYGALVLLAAHVFTVMTLDVFPFAT